MQPLPAGVARKQVSEGLHVTLPGRCQSLGLNPVGVIDNDGFLVVHAAQVGRGLEGQQQGFDREFIVAVGTVVFLARGGRGHGQ